MMQRIVDAIEFESLFQKVLGVLPEIGTAVLILLAFFVAFRLLRRPLSLVLTRAGLHVKLVELLVSGVLRYSLLTVALVMAAAQLGINVAAAITGLGVAGVAVGFAAQDVLANVIAGFVVFLDKPFIVGDWITVGDDYGRVDDITLRSTRIRTPRNSYVVIPNKQIIDTVLENHSKKGMLRIDVPVGIAYKEDVEAAREALLTAISENPEVREEPPPRVVVEALGSSSVDLKLLLWIDDPAEQQRLFFSTVETAKRALDGAGIQIPFPHMQLFVEQVEQRVWDKAGGLLAQRNPGAE